jgi:hypothetical protein
MVACGGSWAGHLSRKMENSWNLYAYGYEGCDIRPNKGWLASCSNIAEELEIAKWMASGYITDFSKKWTGEKMGKRACSSLA